MKRNQYNKHLRLWCLGLFVLIPLFGQAHAAEFSAETVMDRLGKKQKVKVFVKGEKLRQEMLDIFGQKQVLISNPQKGLTLLLYPETKIYREIPAASALSPIGENDEDLKKIGKSRLIGKEEVNGYLCDKYEIAFHNTYRGRLLVWVAQKLNYPIRMVQDGPAEGALNRELTNIREGGVDESLFELPPDFRKVSKPLNGFCGAGVCTISFY
jgi:hypothetical protein